MIVMTDKILGPAVIECDVYTKRVFDDHLLKNDTYRRIQPDEAAQIQTTLKRKVGQFTQSFSHIDQAAEKNNVLLPDDENPKDADGHPAYRRHPW
jgi:hypothetical protein